MFNTTLLRPAPTPCSSRQQPPNPPPEDDKYEVEEVPDVLDSRLQLGGEGTVSGEMGQVSQRGELMDKGEWDGEYKG